MINILEKYNSLAANLKMKRSNLHLFLCEFTLSMRTTDSVRRRRERQRKSVVLRFWREGRSRGGRLVYLANCQSVSDHYLK